MNENESKEQTKPSKKTPKASIFATFGLGNEISYFIENLSMLLASGMTVITALESIKVELQSKRLKTTIEKIENDIRSGSNLWRVLDQTGIFDQKVISLVRIGEQTGKLPENLKVIAIQQEKEREFRSKIQSAMMYPIFVFSLTIIIGLGIAWFILPRLASVFTQLRIQLPLITRILIQTGNFLGTYGSIVIPAIVLLLGIGIYFLFINRRTNGIGQAILFSFPPIKRLIQEVELARFGYILGTLLNSGLPVVESLDSLYNSTTFYRYQRLYAHLKERIEEGNSFQKSLGLYKESNKLIPMPIQQLLISAEQSGHLPETLVKIGEMFERKTDTTTKNLSVILEPILLVIVWLGVLAVAIAVILPLYSLIGGLNK